MAKATANKLTAELRTQTGKGASRRARRDGKVPAVLYGHGADPRHLLLSAHDFAAVLRHSGHERGASPSTSTATNSSRSRRRWTSTRSGATSSTPTCWWCDEARRSPSM